MLQEHLALHTTSQELIWFACVYGFIFLLWQVGRKDVLICCKSQRKIQSTSESKLFIIASKEGNMVIGEILLF